MVRHQYHPGILRVDLGMLQRKFLALPAWSYHIDHRLSRNQHKKTGHSGYRDLNIRSVDKNNDRAAGNTGVAAMAHKRTSLIHIRFYAG